MIKQFILEGVSGAGKTTLKEPLLKRFQAPIILHRGTPSIWVYGVLNKRTTPDIKELYNYEKRTQEIAPTYVIWCRPDPLVAAKRKEEEGDKIIRDGNFVDADALYDVYLTNLTGFDNIIIVETDKMNIMESIDYIVNEVFESETRIF